MPSEHKTLAEIVGPWEEPEFESGLIDRLRDAWSKPISTLTNHELATCLRQNIAPENLMPIARDHVRQRVDDQSEIDDGELARAIDETDYREMREQEHSRILAAQFHPDEKKA